ncbi:MAG TPA: LON peptidase substrate-binding domain-containing protein [Dehalococcoidia bacterium]|nr:LON peptidase substrate-binding domain-containing protein [Dehalococcoidia bacterium]
MSDGGSLLPIFPLGTVLFPGGTLPLRIFEERYKLMIGRCIQERRPFGVVLIKAGVEVGGGAVPHGIGTTARIARVEQLPQGRYNLLTVGVDRFRIVETDTSEPYLQAQVEYLTRADAADAETQATAERVSAMFADHYRWTLLLGDQWTRQVALPTRPEMLADFIANRLEVEVGVKQELLESGTVRECLEREERILTQANRLLYARVQAQQRQKYGGFGAAN